MEFISDVSTEDQYRPSFFELAAQDQLRDLLQPVVRYILSILAQRHPRYLLRIVNRHDEFYALGMYFVERHYLKTWGASFAENFYGLKRRRRPGTGSERAAQEIDLTSSNERLRKREIRLSLWFLIGVPYVKAKAFDLYERLGGGANSDLFSDNPTARANRASILQNETARQRIRRLAGTLYKTLFPYANLGYELWLLLYSVSYVFDRTPFWRPWLGWIGVDVRRMSGKDYHFAQKTAISEASSPFARHPLTGRRPSVFLVLFRYCLLGPRYAFEALKVLLPTAIFFFKFLEWWYASDYSRSIGRGGRGGKDGKGGEAALKAPKRLEPHPKGVLGPDSEGGGRLKTGHCPICRKALTNSTAFPSGWVADYKCAHAEVKEHGRCPVTLVRCDVGDLRKIVG